MKQGNNINYIVKKVVQETKDVVTLFLDCDTSLVTKYKAGQFITVFFLETGHKEGKSYSLSSSPNETFLSITVKDVGDFSHKLVTKKTGDVIVGSFPYGYFYSESELSELLMVVGGIGITPCISMIKSIRSATPQRKITVFYSNKTNEGIIFRKELDKLSLQSEGNLIVRFYVTQEESCMHGKQGRIPAGDILSYCRTSVDQEIFICGSISFVRDYWRLLKNNSVSEEKIYTEAFF